MLPPRIRIGERVEPEIKNGTFQIRGPIYEKTNVLSNWCIIYTGTNNFCFNMADDLGY